MRLFLILPTASRLARSKNLRWSSSSANAGPRRAAWLATRAAIASSPGHHHTDDLCPAARAGLAAPAINLVRLLEASRLAGKVDVVGHRRALAGDGGSQNPADGAVQPDQLFPLQPMGAAPGMNLCPKEAFIRVDVSEPAQDTLVEERRLDGGATFAKAFDEVTRANRQWVRAQRSKRRPELILIQQGQPAKAPEIGIAKLAPTQSGRAATVLKLQNEMRVTRFELVPVGEEQLSGHPEMDEKKLPGQMEVSPVQLNDDVLPVAKYAGNLPRSQLADEIFRRGEKYVGPPQDRARNPSAQHTCAQAADDRFNFGQFGHGCLG